MQLILSRELLNNTNLQSLGLDLRNIFSFENIYFVYDDNKLIGATEYIIYEDEAEIIVGVNKEHRNKGYGKLILEAMTTMLFTTREDISCINLYIRPSNISAYKIAEKCGYKFNFDAIDDEFLIFTNFNPYYKNAKTLKLDYYS